MYPTEKPLHTITLKATADLTKQRFVDVDGDYPAAKARAIGVVRADVLDTENAGVHTLGSAIVEYGGTIAVGEAVEVIGAEGKAGPFTDGVKVGIALSAGADGDFGEIYLIPTA